MKIIKEALVQLHGTENGKRLADMPSTELMFSILRENVENEYSKYRKDMSEEQYHQYIEEIFQIYKEYKLNLDKVEEKDYGKIYGDYAEKIVVVNQKYGLRAQK